MVDSMLILPTVPPRASGRFQDHLEVCRKRCDGGIRLSPSPNMKTYLQCQEFDPIHPPDTLEKYLDSSKHLGPVNMSSLIKEEKGVDPEEEARLERVRRKPLLEECFNLVDFEAVAKQVMKRTAWAYYSSGADDEITMRENHSAFLKVWFRPRVLVDVTTVDFSTTMLGQKTEVPFYVTATALGKLGDPEGEVVLTRAARTHGVIQMVWIMVNSSPSLVLISTDTHTCFMLL